MASTIARPHIQLVTPLALPGADDRSAYAAAIASGVDALVFRGGHHQNGLALGVASDLRRMIERSGGVFIVHRRPRLGLALGVRTFHFGQRSLDQVGQLDTVPDTAFGVSVHSIDEARAAVALGASWLTYGNVFATASHPDRSPRGVEALASIVALVDRPVIAIGGITAGNVAAVLSTGCAGVAVIGAILDAPDPGRAATVLREAADVAVWNPRFTLNLAPFRHRETSLCT